MDVTGSIVGSNNASVMASDKVVNYLEFWARSIRPPGCPSTAAIVSRWAKDSVGYLCQRRRRTDHTKADTLDDMDAAHLAMGDFVLTSRKRWLMAEFPFPGTSRDN